jgi:hypothetical protein
MSCGARDESEPDPRGGNVHESLERKLVPRLGTRVLCIEFSRRDFWSWPGAVASGLGYCFEELRACDLWAALRQLPPLATSSGCSVCSYS